MLGKGIKCNHIKSSVKTSKGRKEREKEQRTNAINIKQLQTHYILIQIYNNRFICEWFTYTN